MTSDEDYVGALVENMDDRFELILDVLESLKDTLQSIEQLLRQK